MLVFRILVPAVGALALLAGAARGADLPTAKPSAPTAASCFSNFANWMEASPADCPLTYLGVTLYGQIDVGAGYSSHGANFNGSYPQGVQELVAKFSQGAKYQWVPNGLSRSNVGIKGEEPLAAGWSFIFNVNTDFDPYSSRLANGPRSLVDNNTTTLGNQSANGDFSRAGQWDNTQGYLGLSNTTYGALTFGRQNSLSADAVSKYDPMAGSYAFSLIGNSATYVSGVGDTETTRYNTSVKYVVSVANFHAGAVAQIGGYDQGNGSNGAYQLDLGADYAGFSFDGIATYARDAVALSLYGSDPLPKGVTPDDLKATLADIGGVVLGAKYTYGPLKLFGGYEYARFMPPSDNYPGGFGSLGGYNVLPGAVNASAYEDNKILQVVWLGVKYAIRDDLDVTGAFYYANQNNYSPVADLTKASYCAANTKPAAPGAAPQGSANSTCAGDISALSALLDYRPWKRLDVYAGVMYSQVSGGIASGYLHSNNIDPTIGLRLSF